MNDIELLGRAWYRWNGLEFLKWLQVIAPWMTVTDSYYHEKWRMFHDNPIKYYGDLSTDNANRFVEYLRADESLSHK